jgi:hypothetical protein
MSSTHDGRQPTTLMLDSERKCFREWFKEYMAADADDLSEESDVIRAVNSDELDADFVEERIRESAPESPVTNGFCAKCQNLFNNWPLIGGSSSGQHDSNSDDSNSDSDKDGWEHAVAWSRSTFELESSTREGCRFCTFLLQGLKDSEALDTYRKIEARLYNLDESAMPSLSIQNWGSNASQVLWLNLPGKVCTHCNNGMALSVNFYSHVLPASGASCFTRMKVGSY